MYFMFNCNFLLLWNESYMLICLYLFVIWVFHTEGDIARVEDERLLEDSDAWAGQPDYTRLPTAQFCPLLPHHVWRSITLCFCWEMAQDDIFISFSIWIDNYHSGWCLGIVPSLNRQQILDGSRTLFVDNSGVNICR